MTAPSAVGATPAEDRVRLTRLMRPASRRAALEADLVSGFRSAPKHLPPKWFYDARGSELFEAITRLPEYYPTRRERRILQAHAGEIAASSGADTLVELGSGTSEKTRLLLGALDGLGTLRRFVPFDVDETVLLAASESVASDFPGLHVHAVVGDFEEHVGLLPRGGRRLIAFLGGTIGNFLPQQRSRFLHAVASSMAPGDSLLLGTDLVKQPERLVAAYDDAAGVTAEFNRNVLHVVRRELDVDVDAESFAHVAVWDAKNDWIEMRLRATRDQVLRVGAHTFHVTAGEEIRTEISAKFRRERVERELRAAGLRLHSWWTDPDGDYGLSLAGKPEHPTWLPDRAP